MVLVGLLVDFLAWQWKAHSPLFGDVVPVSIEVWGSHGGLGLVGPLFAVLVVIGEVP